METKKQSNNDEVKKQVLVTDGEVKKQTLETKKYTIKFGMNYEKESEDEIFVTLNLSNDLKELLNEVVVKTLAVQDYTYKNKTSKRYKCKRWLYDSLYHPERDVLLNKQLVDSGALEISFLNITDAENFVTSVKVCVQDVIKKIMQYKDFGEEVTYTVTR